MRGEEYVLQLRRLGQRLHCRDGVWWMETAPSFCQPAVPFLRIPLGSARPKIFRSAIGYRHFLPDSQVGTGVHAILQMEGSDLRNFDIKALGSSKRAQVRKGLRSFEIRDLEALQPYLEDVRVVCISAALRTGHGKPAKFYTERRQEWADGMERLFALGGRTWLGAFQAGRLVAYYHAFEVDGTAMISAAKSHSEALPSCPNDALLYTYLTRRAADPSCERVVFGDASDRPSLDQFKQNYGFRRVEIPIVRRLNPVVRLVLRVTGRGRS